MCDNEDGIVCPRCGSEYCARSDPNLDDINTYIVLEGDEYIWHDDYITDNRPIWTICMDKPAAPFVHNGGPAPISIYTFCGELKVKRKQYMCRCSHFVERKSGAIVKCSEYTKHWANLYKKIAAESITDKGEQFDFSYDHHLRFVNCSYPWLQKFPSIDINEDELMHTMLYDFLYSQFKAHEWDDRLITALLQVVGSNDDDIGSIKRDKLGQIREAVLKAEKVPKPAKK